MIHSGKNVPEISICKIGKSTNVIYSGAMLIPGSIMDHKISVSTTGVPFGRIFDKT